MTLINLGKEDQEWIDRLVGTMKKRELEQLADGLHCLKGTIPDEIHESTVKSWADLCEKKNPNFDRERFYKASGMYIPPKAEE